MSNSVKIDKYKILDHFRKWWWVWVLSIIIVAILIPLFLKKGAPGKAQNPSGEGVPNPGLIVKFTSPSDAGRGSNHISGYIVYLVELYDYQAFIDWVNAGYEYELGDALPRKNRNGDDVQTGLSSKINWVKQISTDKIQPASGISWRDANGQLLTDDSIPNLRQLNTQLQIKIDKTLIYTLNQEFKSFVGVRTINNSGVSSPISWSTIPITFEKCREDSVECWAGGAGSGEKLSSDFDWNVSDSFQGKTCSPYSGDRIENLIYKFNENNDCVPTNQCSYGYIFDQNTNKCIETPIEPILDINGKNVKLLTAVKLNKKIGGPDQLTTNADPVQKTIFKKKTGISYPNLFLNTGLLYSVNYGSGQEIDVFFIKNKDDGKIYWKLTNIEITFDCYYNLPDGSCFFEGQALEEKDVTKEPGNVLHLNSECDSYGATFNTFSACKTSCDEDINCAGYQIEPYDLYNGYNCKKVNAIASIKSSQNGKYCSKVTSGHKTNILKIGQGDSNTLNSSEYLIITKYNADNNGRDYIARAKFTQSGFVITNQIDGGNEKVIFQILGVNNLQLEPGELIFKKDSSVMQVIKPPSGNSIKSLSLMYSSAGSSSRPLIPYIELGYTNEDVRGIIRWTSTKHFKMERLIHWWFANAATMKITVSGQTINMGFSEVNMGGIKYLKQIDESVIISYNWDTHKPEFYNYVTGVKLTYPLAFKENIPNGRYYRTTLSTTMSPYKWSQFAEIFNENNDLSFCNASFLNKFINIIGVAGSCDDSVNNTLFYKYITNVAIKTSTIIKNINFQLEEYN